MLEPFEGVGVGAELADEDIPVALVAVSDGLPSLGSTAKSVTLIVEASEGVEGSTDELLVGTEPDAPVSVGPPEPSGWLSNHRGRMTLVAVLNAKSWLY